MTKLDEVLAPYLDWPVKAEGDWTSPSDASVLCNRKSGKQTTRPGRCETVLGEDLASPRQLLEAVRRHVTSCFHWGVHFRLEAQVLGEGGRLFWTADGRAPSPEEILLSGRTPDSSYWMSASGHPEATEPMVEPKTHLRIRVEVEPL